jgi:hypothetical protein
MVVIIVRKHCVLSRHRHTRAKIKLRGAPRPIGVYLEFIRKALWEKEDDHDPNMEA